MTPMYLFRFLLIGASECYMKPEKVYRSWTLTIPTVDESAATLLKTDRSFVAEI